MHIALYSSGWPLSHAASGVVTYVDCLRTEYLRQGHRVSIFTASLGEGCKDPDVYLVQPSWRHRLGQILLRFARKDLDSITAFSHVIGQTIKRVHRFTPIDVIEFEESFGWFRDVAELNPTIPMVVKLHGPTFLIERGVRARLPFVRGKIQREGQALRSAKVLVAPSACTLQDTIEHYDLKPVLAQRIPNPFKSQTKIDLWSPEQCDKNTVLFIGRFDRIKGGDTVLKVFRRLLDVRPSMKLIFVGSDIGIPDPDGTMILFEAFTDRLFTPSEKARITFLGKLPPEKLPALRAHALLTLMTSLWENQPYTVLEALLQACPVVAVNAGGVNEIVENSVTGWLADPGDIDGLCNRVLQVVNNPTGAQKLGLKGRELVLTNHAPEFIAQQNIEIYEKAIAIG